jgi:NTP pyrophosphatase (non-canonical NTP hydrolase)
MKERETTQSGKCSVSEVNTNFIAMRNQVKNKLRMYNAVQLALQHNSASWNGLAAFENAVSRFNLKVTELESLAVQKSKALKGAKAKRDNLRKALGDEALKLANALYSYASEKGDFELKEKVKFVPSSFRNASQRVFLQMIAGIIDEGTQHVTDLSPFGFDQARIDDIALLSLEFAEIVDLPRQAVVSRKVMSAEIDELVTVIDDELNDHLDRLVMLFSKTAPSFVKTYKSSRTIIDTRATRNSSTDKTNQSDTSTFLGDEFDSSP